MSPIPLYLIGGLCFGSGGLVPLGGIGDFTSLAGEVGVVLLLLLLGPGVLRGRADHRAAPLLDGRPARHRAQRRARASPWRSSLGWGPVGAMVIGRRHLHLVVRHRREGAVRPGPTGQPRDAGDPLDPRVRGPGDGRLPADPHRGADRRVVPRRAGGRRDLARRRRGGAGGGAAVRALRLRGRRQPGPRGLPAQGARHGAAGGGVRVGAAGLGGGRGVPAGHRDLRVDRGERHASCWSRCATCSRRCSSSCSG